MWKGLLCRGVCIYVAGVVPHVSTNAGFKNRNNIIITKAEILIQPQLYIFFSNYSLQRRGVSRDWSMGVLKSTGNGAACTPPH